MARVGRWTPFLALLFIAALQIHRLDDPDTWWHLASGRLIAESGDIPRTDPFSYTAPGAAWTNRQWLFDYALYHLWRIGGPAGPALGAGALFVLGFWSLYVVAARRMPSWAGAAVTALAAMVAAERFTVRPEAVSFCLLGVYVMLLDKGFTWPRAVLIVLLQALWANMHALSVLGLAPLAITLVAVVIVRRLPLPMAWRRANERAQGEFRPLVAALVGAALAECATPWGLKGALFPLDLLRDITGGRAVSFTIVEHRATNLAELTPTVAVAFQALAVLAGLAAVASLRRLRIAPLLLALAFGWVSMLARRNVALLGFGVMPLVADGLGPAMVRIEAWLGRHSRLLNPLPGLAVAALLVFQTARVVRGDWYQEARLTRTFGLGSSLLLYPQGAVDFLERHAPRTRVFNDDLQGGFVLWNGYPTRRVFIDGRVQVYPSEIQSAWQRVLDDPRHFPAVARQWKVGAVLLHHPSPGRLELAGAISRMPGWRVAYLDAGAVVLLADGKPAGTPVGATGPAPAAWTPGLAGKLEQRVRALRRPYEEATVYYQRGRAIHFLLGPPAYALARADFEQALKLVPEHDPARIGLGATTLSARGRIQR